MSVNTKLTAKIKDTYILIIFKLQKLKSLIRLHHGYPNILGQRVTAVTMGCFAGCTWEKI